MISENTFFFFISLAILETYLHQHIQNCLFLLSCCPVGILIFGGWAEKEKEKKNREGGRRRIAKSNFLKVSRNPKQLVGYNGEIDPGKSGLKKILVTGPVEVLGNQCKNTSVELEQQKLISKRSPSFRCSFSETGQNN